MGGPNYMVMNDAWFESSNGATCTPGAPADSCAGSGPGGGTPLTWGRSGHENFWPRAFSGAVSLNGSIWITGGAYRSPNFSITPCAAAQADFDCFLDTALADG